MALLDKLLVTPAVVIATVLGGEAIAAGPTAGADPVDGEFAAPAQRLVGSVAANAARAGREAAGGGRVISVEAIDSGAGPARYLVRISRADQHIVVELTASLGVLSQGPDDHSPGYEIPFLAE